MRTFVAIALCALLSACFSSDGPVFAEERGQCPFTTPATYEEIDETPYRFVFESDGHYCKVTDPDGNITQALFVPMGRGRWIVQGSESRPTYAIMRRRGDRLIQYMPRCQDFTTSRLRLLGVTFNEERNRCRVTEARQIETLFRNWRGGRPTGAYRLTREPPSPSPSDASSTG